MSGGAGRVKFQRYFKGISRFGPVLGEIGVLGVIGGPIFSKMSGVAGSVQLQRYFKSISKVPAVLGEMGVWGVSVHPLPPILPA